MDADVVCVNEKELGKDVTHFEVLHPGYIMYRMDRDNKRVAVRFLSQLNQFGLEMSEDILHPRQWTWKSLLG